MTATWWEWALCALVVCVSPFVTIGVLILCRKKLEWLVRRERERVAVSESGRPFVVWMADFRDRREHGVTMDQAEATARAGTGIYESLCEAKFLPDMMVARPGPRCLKCERRYQRWIGAGRPARKPLLWRLSEPYED